MVRGTTFVGVCAHVVRRAASHLHTPPARLAPCAAVCVAGLLLVSAVRANEIPEIKVDTLSPGTSARDDKRIALQQIPLRQVAADKRKIVDAILKDVSLFRRLPTIRCEADPKLYGYFCDHPDVAVSIWRAMGVSGLQMSQTKAGEFTCDAGDGTVGEVEVLYRTPTSSLVACSGTFTSPLLPRAVKGMGLMHLQVQTQRDPSGRNYVIHKADMFVSFPSQTVDLVARTIAPVSNKIMDKNFEEISLFLRMMDEASRRRPSWIYDIAPRLEGVPKDRATELVDLTRSLHAGPTLQIGAKPAGPAIR